MSGLSLLKLRQQIRPVRHLGSVSTVFVVPRLVFPFPVLSAHKAVRAAASRPHRERRTGLFGESDRRLAAQVPSDDSILGFSACLKCTQAQVFFRSPK